MPERLRAMNEKLSKAMDDLIEGKLEPAALTALYRAARVQVEIYRLSDRGDGPDSRRRKRGRGRPGRRCLRATLPSWMQPPPSSDWHDD